MGSMSERRSELKKFLASIATIKGDLSNVTAPPFVLAPKSAVEFPAAWAEYPSILVAPAVEEDPKRRMLLVLKWYLASLKRQQYAGADGEADGLKKPLNAFLGELFIASFHDDAGETKLISEQVSHHPPVTACYIWNDTYGVRAEGYTAQKVTLTSSLNVQVTQIGHAILRIDKYDDAYLVTLPNLTVKGILSGSLYPELDGSSYIVSSTGYTAMIDYEGKGLFQGKKNTVHASMYPTASPNDVLYTVSGQWNEKFTFRDETSQEEIETYDTNVAKPTPTKVRDINEQDSWESRKAWAGVLQGIQEEDMSAVAKEKTKIEEAQRGLRRREQEKGSQDAVDCWERIFFSRTQGDETFEQLRQSIGEELRSDMTNGVWKWDANKASKAKPPYHQDLTPLGPVSN